MLGLPVSRLVNVKVNLGPKAAQVRNFGILNIAGDSNVISGLQRSRNYGSFEEVEIDFGVDAPETLAAELYFSQVPQPAELQISRWLRVATAAFLNGGVLTVAQQALANFTAVTAGGMRITIDSTLKTLGSLNFSGATNLNDVCTIVNAALTGGVMSWDGTKFIVTSSTTGVMSSVSDATPPVSGTDISTLLQLTAALASPTVPGYAAETPVQCAAALANLSPDWYSLQFAASVQPTDDQNVAVASFIEALSVSRTFGVTITNPSVLDSTVTNDLASRLQALNLNRSYTQYSQNPYAVASFFGRSAAIDFTANNSTITVMYKQEPGVVAENVTSQQADTLQNKNCNIFVEYENDTAIIQYGAMASGLYFDEIQGTDWLQNEVQTNCYNLLYTSPTKIPQTDSGMTQLMNAVQAACDAGVNNGLIGPGTWLGPNIGQLKTGQFLKSGYYIFADSLAAQSQGDRQARKAPPITVCIKLAGAIQEVNVTINVDR